MPKQRKRNAAPGKPESGGLGADEEYAAEVWRLLYDYLERVLAPQRMAEMRRRRGDRLASPRDYDCRCPVPAKDGLPDCWPLRAECRFRDRMRLRPKIWDNAFEYNLTRELWRDFLAQLPKMPDRELLDLIDKMRAFREAERRREERRKAEPKPEAAPLKENWKWCDVC